MIRWPWSLSPELGLAAVLLVTAAATDLFWVRPQERQLDQLAARRKAAERSVEMVLRERGEWDSIQDYLNRRGMGTGTWKDRYQAADPLRILEGTRERSGLQRLDLRLASEKRGNPFVQTTYFMSVNGSFEKQMGFLRELEMTQPLVTVESFVMGARDEDPGVDLKLNISLLSLPGEDGK